MGGQHPRARPDHEVVAPQATVRRGGGTPACRYAPLPDGHRPRRGAVGGLAPSEGGRPLGLEPHRTHRAHRGGGAPRGGPGEALWWYSRRLKGVVRWDLNLTERTERIVATMPPEAYQPVDTSTNGTYQDACAYDPVNRVVLAIPWYTFNGDFPGMLLVKVDPPYETEWIPMRAPTVDDFKGVTRLPWGNRLVYLPWAHAFYILGGHNPGVTGTRPARDPDPALSTKELTRWHWLFRLGGIPPTPPAPPAPPDPEPGTVPPTPPPTPTSPPEPGTVPPPPPPPPVPRVDIQVTKPQGVDVYVNGQKM